MQIFTIFFNLPFGTHLVIGTIIRLFLVLYAKYHDETYAVQYTDTDYKVFTDASWHIVNGESPYNRHTYRYSPLLALMLVPNILLNSNFGKILFSFIDIVVGVVIKKLVTKNKVVTQNNVKKLKVEQIASHSALFWIYNPLAIVIATRGNADSLTSFFVMMSLLFHETDVVRGLKKYFISGIFLGIAIHFRLYPIVFSFPMFLAIGNYRINRNTSFLYDLYQMFPNKKQISFVFGCILTLSALTVICFFFYGYEFLFETYIYHALRKDIKHNFSLFFYLQYLTADEKTQYWYKAIPFILLTTGFGLRYSRMHTLNFALLTQAIILVIFNSVITSQYFIWFLSLLPLCISDIKLSKRKAFTLFFIWIVKQAAWLYYAYQLEFHGRNVFIYIWCQSVAFYIVNLYIVHELIKNYKPECTHEHKQD